MGVAGEAPDRAAAANLDSVVGTAKGLVDSFEAQRRRARVASALLLGFVGAALTLTVVFALLVTDYFSGFLNAHSTLNGALFIGIAGASWLGVAGAAYSLLRGRDDEELLELSALVSRIEAHRDTETTTENGLVLADKILLLLPEVVRKRSENPVLYGILSAIATLVISRFAPLAALVGIVVWLYFRRRADISYKQGVRKIESQRRLFERGKELYLEAL